MKIPEIKLDGGWSTEKTNRHIKELIKPYMQMLVQHVQDINVITSMNDR